MELIVAVSRFGCHIPYGHRKDIVLSLTSHDFTQGSDIELYDGRGEGHPRGHSGSNTRAGTSDL
jgi:hypothetical protein